MTDRRILVVRTVLVWILLELLAAAQVRAPSGDPVLFSWARAAAAPVLWAGEWIGSTASGLVQAMASSASLMVVNRRLRLELETSEALRRLMAEDVAAVLELDRLAASVPSLAAGAVPGRAVYRNPTQGRMMVLVEERRRIDPDTPAIARGGVVGRVVRSDGRRCWLELVTHPAAAVAVQTPDGSLHGLAVGSGTRAIEVQFIPRQAELLRGTELVTSGADGIYPPGLPVCRVTSVRESASAFLVVQAELAAGVDTARVILLLDGWNAGGGGGDPRR
ncbi:MAG TPA: rod shape-determining protein MreC [Candidatus Sulfomarinibacteraceae bacterium]|nr:rod shape-determining protein MreC [Candidatus Sulfomarinibacteraceae bacterium]